MRSLATSGTDIVARGFAGIERLKDVRVENGWVIAERGEECEPLDEYFSGRKPHVELAKLPSTKDALIRFSKRYGALVEDFTYRHSFRLGVELTNEPPQGTRAESTVSFPEGMFWFEQWRFQLLLELAADLNRGVAMRGVFEKAINEAEKRCLPVISRQIDLAGTGYLVKLTGLWQSIIRDLHYVLGESEPQRTQSGETQDTGLAYTRGLLKSARERLASFTEEDLKRLARKYLERSLNEELRSLRPLVDLDSESGPQLYSHCENLKQRLYWMLALDLAGRRLPHVCISCGDLFLASRENAVYCGKQKCRERERKRRNWQKNKQKYNRARREKYAKQRRARQARRQSP